MYSDWTKQTFINGTSPAINATNLNKNEELLEDVADELNYHHGVSSRNIIDYALDNNVKEIDNCENSNTYDTTGTLTKSTVLDVICGTSGVKILEPNNTAGYLAIDKEVTLADTMDLTEFWSGAASASTDYISLIYYVSDETYFSSLNVRLGINSSNYYYYTFASFSTGWNFTDLRKDLFASSGSPDWSDVQWIQLGYTTLSNAQNEYVIFNKVFLVRRDSLAFANPWFMNDGSGNYDELPYISADDYTDTVVYFDKRIGRKGFFQEIADITDITEIFTDVNSFSFKCEAYSKSDGYGPSIIWYIDSSNYLRIDVVSSYLKIYECVAASGAYEVETALWGSIELNDRMELWIEKIADIVRVRLEVDGQNPIYAEYDITLSATAQGEVGFCVCNTAQYYFVSDFVIGHDQKSMPPFLVKSTPCTVIKYFSESVTGDTSLNNDTELCVKLPGNGIFELEANIIYFSDGADDDMKIAWDEGGTGDLYAIHDGRIFVAASSSLSSYTDIPIYINNVGLDTSVIVGAMGSGEIVYQDKILVYTYNGGGVLQFQWCQNATGGGDTLTVKYGSYIKINKLS